MMKTMMYTEAIYNGLLWLIQREGIIDEPWREERLLLFPFYNYFRSKGNQSIYYLFVLGAQFLKKTECTMGYLIIKISQGP